MGLLLFALLPVAHAVCDEPIFAVLAAPAPESDGHGVTTGTSTLNGAAAVGGRFSLKSAGPSGVWKEVLVHAENQPEWVPKRFGYEVANWIDPTHMYMRFDIGFVMDAVHVRRQLVVNVTSGDVGERFRTCWKMIDPAPHMATIAGWVAEDVTWERASAGWWEVTPQADGTSLINYQWWAETGKIPTAVQRWGLSRTLPDLLDAFEARVLALAGEH